MNPDITHGETCQLVHHYDDHSYGHEQVQMGPYDDGHSQWRCGRCHAVLPSISETNEKGGEEKCAAHVVKSAGHLSVAPSTENKQASNAPSAVVQPGAVGATPEPPPSEATPLSDARWFMLDGQWEQRAKTMLAFSKELEKDLSKSRREVAALKEELHKFSSYKPDSEGRRVGTYDKPDFVTHEVYPNGEAVLLIRQGEKHTVIGFESTRQIEEQLAAKTAEASDLAEKLQETEKLQGGWTRLQQLVVSYSPKEMVRFKESATKEGGKVVNTWVRFITSVWHERDDLAAKNARGAHDHFRTIEACNELREHRDDLAAKHQRAEADANRLDWLESTKSAVEYYGAPMWMCEDALGVEILGKGNSVREAIDAATQRKDA